MNRKEKEFSFSESYSKLFANNLLESTIFIIDNFEEFNIGVKYEGFGICCYCGQNMAT